MLKVNLFLPSINAYTAVIKPHAINQKTQHQQKNISFRGMPWWLYPQDEGVSGIGSISANDAIKLHKKFACGNYLDIGDDKYNFEYSNKIRENNLGFLDRITSLEEQRKFIQYYKKLTGFPYLEDVSNNIKKEFVKAVQKTSNDLYYSRYKVIEAGYDGICSVGRKRALPGSDLDKAYVIIAGTGNFYEDEEVVNQFKGGIWKNTDQRILSYNHDEAAFPQVYTLAQLEKLTAAAEKIAKGMYAPYEYDGRGCPMHHQDEMMFRGMALQKFETELNKYTTDYVDANRFYINVCREFPLNSYDDITREKIKNIGFVLEAMREGEKFPQFGKVNNPAITDSLVYKLVNLSQLKALKGRSDSKPKRVARVTLGHDFDSWTTDKQYRFIKALIKSSCGNNKFFTSEFAGYFSQPGEDLFEPLINELMG